MTCCCNVTRQAAPTRQTKQIAPLHSSHASRRPRPLPLLSPDAAHRGPSGRSDARAPEGGAVPSRIPQRHPRQARAGPSRLVSGNSPSGIVRSLGGRSWTRASARASCVIKELGSMHFRRINGKARSSPGPLLWRCVHLDMSLSLLHMLAPE